LPHRTALAKAECLREQIEEDKKLLPVEKELFIEQRILTYAWANSEPKTARRVAEAWYEQTYEQ